MNDNPFNLSVEDLKNPYTVLLAESTQRMLELNRQYLDEKEELKQKYKKLHIEEQKRLTDAIEELKNRGEVDLI